ncbi:MAG: hypothetical protein U7123_06975 [Potamolinea sp.]
MLAQVRLLPGAISDLFVQVSISGKITLADRYGLMAALLEEEISEEERASIDRLFYAVCRGRMKIVDEISALSFNQQPQQTARLRREISEKFPQLTFHPTNSPILIMQGHNRR